MSSTLTGPYPPVLVRADEALIIATPGIERFDYFRHVVRRREGSEPPAVLLGLQDRFDTHFLDSPAWQRARAAD